MPPTSFSRRNNLRRSSVEHRRPRRPPIGERFRTILGKRDEEATVRLYKEFLSELTVNVKSVITELSIIAGEQRVHAKGIAGAICTRIIEVPINQKLPCLYLLDSIVKNIGREYVKYFGACLSDVFCSTYKQGNCSMRAAMRHLFETWESYFPPSILLKIETELQFSKPDEQQTSGSLSTRHSQCPSPTSKEHNGLLEGSCYTHDGVNIHNTKSMCNERRAGQLISAYGNERGQCDLLEKFPEIEQVGVKATNWQSSKGKEVVFEAMSPYLPSQKKTGGVLYGWK